VAVTTATSGWVSADLQGFFRRRREGLLAPVDNRPVAAAAAVHHVARPVGGKQQVVAVTAGEQVDAATADDKVIASSPLSASSPVPPSSVSLGRVCVSEPSFQRRPG
jgi:hypothetical protein